jgi:hypothetical protein
MRHFALAIVGAVCLLQPASGQDRFEQQVRAQLDRVGENLKNKGLELTTQIYTGKLGEDRNEEVSVRLRAGVRYAIVGVCDEDCKDLDLVLYNGSGRELASDIEEDDVPVVEVTPDRDGLYMARAVMANCGAEPCAYGLGLFATSVDRFERQVREQLSQAAQKLGKSGFTLTHHIHTSALKQNEDEDVTLELDRGHGYLIIGVCDNDCKDVDLRLFDAAGAQVDKDVERDDYPAVAVDVTSTQRYTVRASMAACSAAPCRYGFGVFAK